MENGIFLMVVFLTFTGDSGVAYPNNTPVGTEGQQWTSQTSGSERALMRCFECSAKGDTIQDPKGYCDLDQSNKPTLCKASDRFCTRVTRLTEDKQVYSALKGCAKECTPGCAPEQFGLKFTRCTTCCTTDLCNSGMKDNQTTPATSMKSTTSAPETTTVHCTASFSCTSVTLKTFMLLLALIIQN